MLRPWYISVGCTQTIVPAWGVRTKEMTSRPAGSRPLNLAKLGRLVHVDEASGVAGGGQLLLAEGGDRREVLGWDAAAHDLVACAMRRATHHQSTEAQTNLI